MFWEAFASVWCFFAAAGSVVILVHFERVRQMESVCCGPGLDWSSNLEPDRRPSRLAVTYCAQEYRWPKPVEDKLHGHSSEQNE